MLPLPAHNARRRLVLDIETGEYEIDSDHLAASNRAAAKRPNALLFTVRIGYKTGGRFGASSRGLNTEALRTRRRP